MNTFGGERSTGPSPKDVAWLLIGVAGIAFCLTLLFLGMRAVMDIGGYCADGGPYVSRHSCPDGVPLAMVGGIFGTFLFGGILAVGGTRIGGTYGGLVFLAWPALFLSLGWNFLEYGVRPPGGGGPEFGWLLCGVVFVVMGGGPVLGLLPTRGKARRDPATMRRLVNDLRARQVQLVTRERSSRAWTSTQPTERMDLTSRLERLAALHTGGSLTDAEFDEAKRRVIAEVAAGR